LLRLWIVRVCKLASFLWSPDHTLIAHGVEPRLARALDRFESAVEAFGTTLRG